MLALNILTRDSLQCLLVQEKICTCMGCWATLSNIFAFEYSLEVILSEIIFVFDTI